MPRPRDIFSIGALTLGLGLSLWSLGSCSSNPPTPFSQCVERGPREICGRSGCSLECSRYELACPRPLTLRQQTDGGKLYCALERTP